jgi:ketosteroid isomerase-like protein
MSRLFTPVVLGTLIGACAPAAPPAPTFTEQDRAAIVAAEAAMATAANAKDWAAWTSHYAADGVLMPPNGPEVVGAEAIQAYFTGFPPMSALTLTQTRVDGAGDWAWVHGAYGLVFDGAAPDSGKYLEIWQRQGDGNWKMVRDMFSSNIPLPAPTPAK